MNDYIVLLFGIACAGVGGELFVRGLVGLGRWARIAPAIVAATFAAFATSSPELSVGINSALAGEPQISFGDVLGSNIANVGLIIGLTLVVGRMRVSRAEIKRDFPVALAVPVILGVLAADGILSRTDGVVLVAIFVGWLIAVVMEARRQHNAGEQTAGRQRIGWSIFFSSCGLGLLMVAGRFIVSGAVGIASTWGIGTFVIGALIVAFGTSVPELATSIIAKARGYDEISLGTILGSNLFNCLGIVGVVSLICPIVISFRDIVLPLTFGALTLLPAYPDRNGIIGRWRGFMLLGLYAAYVFLTLAPASHHW